MCYAEKRIIMIETSFLSSFTLIVHEAQLQTSNCTVCSDRIRFTRAVLFCVTWLSDCTDYGLFPVYPQGWIYIKWNLKVMPYTRYSDVHPLLPLTFTQPQRGKEELQINISVSYRYTVYIKLYILNLYRQDGAARTAACSSSSTALLQTSPLLEEQG